MACGCVRASPSSSRRSSRRPSTTASAASACAQARRSARASASVERVHKHGSLRFALLVLSLIATAVVVTVAMFETLYYVMG